MFVPLNNFFSTAILNPSLEIGTGYEVLTTFTACRERPFIMGVALLLWSSCVEVGWLSGRLASINKWNQRSSQLRWFIFVQIAY